MKWIGRVFGDPYVHVFAIGLLVFRLATGAEGEPSQVTEQVKPPPQCVRCKAEHGWGNPCPETSVIARASHPLTH